MYEAHVGSLSVSSLMPYRVDKLNNDANEGFLRSVLNSEASEHDSRCN